MSSNQETAALMLLERHLGACNLRMHFLYGRSLDHQTICDATQDALIQAAVHFDPQQGNNPRAYLMTIARNNCLKEIRRLQRFSFKSDQQSEAMLDSNLRSTQPKNPSTKMDLQRVAQYLDRMKPTKQRDALVLAISGYSCAEIAAELELRPGSAAVLVSRARREIRWKFPDLFHAKRRSTFEEKKRQGVNAQKRSKSTGVQTQLALGRSK